MHKLSISTDDLLITALNITKQVDEFDLNYYINELEKLGNVDVIMGLNYELFKSEKIIVTQNLIIENSDGVYSLKPSEGALYMLSGIQVLDPNKNAEEIVRSFLDKLNYERMVLKKIHSRKGVALGDAKLIFNAFQFAALNALNEKGCITIINQKITLSNKGILTLENYESINDETIISKK